jgi:AcrR family transcriptional regulator
MTRQPDPTKKPALLERVVDYLADKSLSALTFRGLATALDVSTFTLVYYFGTRAELVHEIIAALAARQRALDVVIDPATATLDEYVQALKEGFEKTLLPANRALQRLQFEAQMFEAVQLELGVGAMRAVHEERQLQGRDTLVALGLDLAEATIESRLILDTFYGIQVGLVANGDEDRARAAFERAIDNHRQRIVLLTAGHVHQRTA